jgi:predicted nucleotidyltransferase
MDFERLLDRVRGIRDRLERKVFFAAVLAEALKGEAIPVIVGGTAVEFYTMGGYSTLDLDLVCSRRDVLDGLLKGFGFRRYGRHWYREDVDLAVEVPDSVLVGSEEKLTKVEIGGLIAYMIGIEDIIADRLNAYVYWRSEDDGRWARRMMLLHRDKIDWPYLEERSKRDGTYDALRSLKAEVDGDGG